MWGVLSCDCLVSFWCEKTKEALKDYLFPRGGVGSVVGFYFRGAPFVSLFFVNVRSRWLGFILKVFFMIG